MHGMAISFWPAARPDREQSFLWIVNASAPHEASGPDVIVDLFQRQTRKIGTTIGVANKRQAQADHAEIGSSDPDEEL
eukprot:scaffold66583_cov17-Prasinocladus_malaysianus.AAC.1